MAINNNTTPQPNVGSVDRVIRGILGTWLVMTSLNRLFSVAGILQAASGYGLLASAATGQCAMMRRMHAFTIPGQSNSLMNQLKQAMPGQGINPIQTQQASPKKDTRQTNPDEPLANAYAIG
jgi:uncharacterized membrane protein